MNTPEEHAAAVMRAPGQITVASIAGAIRAYADEIKGSQIEHHRSQLETKLQKHLSAAQGQIAELARQRDAEREARRALDVALRTAGRSCINLHHDKADRHGSNDSCPVEARIAAALILASELP